jgi:hypothetical protein
LKVIENELIFVLISYFLLPKIDLLYISLLLQKNISLFEITSIPHTHPRHKSGKIFSIEVNNKVNHEKYRLSYFFRIIQKKPEKCRKNYFIGSLKGLTLF